MQLRISNIPVEGCDVDFHLSSQDLRKPLKTDDPFYRSMSQAVAVELFVERLRDNVLLSGNMAGQLTPTCDRCLESFDFTVNHKVGMTCVPYAKAEDEDEGVHPYRGDEIDLTDLMRNQLYLTLPMVFHCKESCLGLCSACGGNLNKDACKCKSKRTSSTPTLKML